LLYQHHQEFPLNCLLSQVVQVVHLIKAAAVAQVVYVIKAQE
jgi:hypothetical protein